LGYGGLKMSIIQDYNELFTDISKIDSVEAVREVSKKLKKFKSKHQEESPEDYRRLQEMFAEKVQGLLKLIENTFDEKNAILKKEKEKAYNSSREPDMTNEINTAVLRLMARLPKKKTTGTGTQIMNILMSSLNSRAGCLAVLELLKYPVYSEMIPQRIIEQAAEGSKSEDQKIFEQKQQQKISEIEQERNLAYLQGFHLRNMINKGITGFQNTSFWDTQETQGAKIEAKDI
jgi:hypothetical protein